MLGLRKQGSCLLAWEGVTGGVEVQFCFCFFTRYVPGYFIFLFILLCVLLSLVGNFSCPYFHINRVTFFYSLKPKRTIPVLLEIVAVRWLVFDTDSSVVCVCPVISSF